MQKLIRGPTFSGRHLNGSWYRDRSFRSNHDQTPLARVCTGRALPSVSEFSSSTKSSHQTQYRPFICIAAPMPEASQVNSDGSCSHLYEIGEDDRRQILKRYRKVMNWCVSEDMRIDTALKNGNIVSSSHTRSSGMLSILGIGM